MQSAPVQPSHLFAWSPFIARTKKSPIIDLVSFATLSNVIRILPTEMIWTLFHQGDWKLSCKIKPMFIFHTLSNLTSRRHILMATPRFSNVSFPFLSEQHVLLNFHSPVPLAVLSIFFTRPLFLPSTEYRYYQKLCSTSRSICSLPNP